ncbi:MAG: hypothetical protein ACPL25_01135 [Ignavibacteria bacterium]
MKEKEFSLKIIDGNPFFSVDALEYFRSSSVKSFKAKLYPDLEEICKQEKISANIVKKIADIQKIPLEIALGVVISKGKIKE